MSRDLYSSRSTMLQATVLLCLVACAVITQTSALVNDTVPINNAARPALLSNAPNCAADYPKMGIQDRKAFIKVPYPHAVCVRADGYFVATILSSNRKFIYMFDTCGWIKKKIMMPSRSGQGSGCAFTSTKMFYATYAGRHEILQFTSDGVFEKVFATGLRFLRLTTYNHSLVYAGIFGTRKIRAYDTATGNLLYSFETTSGNARGLAFDPSGILHVSNGGNVIEHFMYNGFKVSQRTYPEVGSADGILVDSNYYTLIADRGGRRQIAIYTYNGLLTKKITGFSLPIDVAMGYKCGYLLVDDYSRGGVYLL